MEINPSGQGDDSGAQTHADDISRHVPKPRGESATYSIPVATSDEAVWAEFFERYKRRIARAERIQDQGLRSVDHRKTIVFRLYLLMAVLAILTASLTAVLTSLYFFIDQSHPTPNIVSGGGFVLTGSMTLVLNLMRRQIRDEERDIKSEGEDLRNIEAAMFAARVAPDPLARCELLGELVAAVNAVLARQRGR